MPLTPPDGYAPKDFELVGRYVAYLVQTISDQEVLHKQLVDIFPGWKNSGEWNYQRTSLFSMSPSAAQGAPPTSHIRFLTAR